MTVAAATREITAGDCLKGRVTFAYSKKVKKGRVIKQSQRPGKTLTFRSKVNLTVSKGKRK
jgi:beta-lactam-binding protein with PASTA domain